MLFIHPLNIHLNGYYPHFSIENTTSITHARRSSKQPEHERLGYYYPINQSECCVYFTSRENSDMPFWKHLLIWSYINGYVCSTGGLFTSECYMLATVNVSNFECLLLVFWIKIPWKRQIFRYNSMLRMQEMWFPWSHVPHSYPKKCKILHQWRHSQISG